MADYFINQILVMHRNMGTYRHIIHKIYINMLQIQSLNTRCMISQDINVSDSVIFHQSQLILSSTAVVQKIKCLSLRVVHEIQYKPIIQLYK